MILTLRDPRDWLAALYFGMFSHPPGILYKPSLEFLEYSSQLGVDQWVKKIAQEKITFLYEPYLRAFLEQPKDKRLFLSYNRFCIDTHSFISELTEFLQIGLTEERVSAISQAFSLDNENGIRYRHQYSNPLPGRAKRELRGETLDFLNNICGDALELMSYFEKEPFKELYS